MRKWLRLTFLSDYPAELWALVSAQASHCEARRRPYNMSRTTVRSQTKIFCCRDRSISAKNALLELLHTIRLARAVPRT